MASPVIHSMHLGFRAVAGYIPLQICSQLLFSLIFYLIKICLFFLIMK